MVDNLNYDRSLRTSFYSSVGEFDESKLDSILLVIFCHILLIFYGKSVFIYTNYKELPHVDRIGAQ